MEEVNYDVIVSEYQHWTPSFDCLNDSDEDPSEDDEDYGVHGNENISLDDEGSVKNDKPEEKVMMDPTGIRDFLNGFEINKSYSLSLSVPPGFQRKEVGEEEEVNMRDKGEAGTPICEFFTRKDETSNTGDVNYQASLLVEGCGATTTEVTGRFGHTISGGKKFKINRGANIPQNISLLEQFNRYIEYGMSLGLEMEGAKVDLKKCIDRMSGLPVSQ